MFFNNQFIVVGLGKSGLLVAQKLQTKNCDVYVWDDNEETRKNACNQGLKIFDKNTHDFNDFGYIVLSPGIPEDIELVKFLENKNYQVIGEVYLLFQERKDRKFIGITGTNGKSTTTYLVNHVLQYSGVNTKIGGNFDLPSFYLDDVGENGAYILEMSSYMLERIADMKFNIGVFLNLTPDHIERHKTFENYKCAKLNIIQNHDDYVGVICNNSPIMNEIILNQNFDEDKNIVIEKNISYKNGYIIENKKNVINLNNNVVLKMQHNQENATVAYKIAKLFKIDNQTIQNAFDEFSGLEHRCEFVGCFKDVNYINDSKATNIEAAISCIQNFDDMVLICGGMEKKSADYDLLLPYLKNIKQIYVIGTDTKDIVKWFNANDVNFENVVDLETAVKYAAQYAFDNKISNVVLSPFCASWDQFKSFEQRGDLFKKYVISND